MDGRRARGRASAVSRSLLDERFRQVLGRSPIRYLTEWRMHLAEELLATTEHRCRTIARRVGYDSEEAFSRAFKRAHGALAEPLAGDRPPQTPPSVVVGFCDRRRGSRTHRESVSTVLPNSKGVRCGSCRGHGRVGSSRAAAG